MPLPKGGGTFLERETHMDTIKFKRLDPHAEIPTRAHPTDAGLDLRCTESIVLGPGERKTVGTGLAVAIPEGHAGFLQPRSGLASKYGITIVNTPGLIDSHYRGELKVILLNTDQNTTFSTPRGSRIAQLVILKVDMPTPIEVDALDETDRGADGYGSSGVR